MSDDPIDRRDYGALEQKVAQLTADVHALKETVEAMRDMMQQAQGGWRTVMALSGVAAAVGALFTWAAAHIKFS